MGWGLERAKERRAGVGTALKSVAALAALVNVDDKVISSCGNTFT
jgi:hypothetical protein